MATEIDETLQRIQSEHKGVIGVVVANSEGVVIRSTPTTNFEGIVDNYPGVISDVVERARQIIKENDELTFLKIRTKRVEYIVVPDREFTLITLLTPGSSTTPGSVGQGTTTTATNGDD